jgi:hypothetical protein
MSLNASALAADDIKITGDLRYRGVQQKEATDDSRLYQQLRARLGVRAKVQDDVDAVIRMATATSPVSNNQVLGESTAPGMARRSFGLDLAYGEWKFVDEAKLNLGRTPNPFYAPNRTQLVWDHDLTFEGMSLSYAPKWTDSSGWISFGSFIISENYSAPRDSVDTGIVGIDLGYSFQAAGQWTVHAARYNYFNVQDQLITRVESGATLDSRSGTYKGNTVYTTAGANKFAYGFIQTEVGIDWKMKQDANEYAAYFDLISNELATGSGDAWEAGVSGRFGRFGALVAYVMKKSNSMVSNFTDSDMNGGGTDNRGTKISLSYQLSDRTSVVLTDYRGTRGMDTVSRDFEMQHLDFALQF